MLGSRWRPPSADRATPDLVRSGAVATIGGRSAALRQGDVRILVPVRPVRGTIASRTGPLPASTVERHRTPHPATVRDQTGDDPRPRCPARIPGPPRPPPPRLAVRRAPRRASAPERRP